MKPDELVFDGVALDAESAVVAILSWRNPALDLITN